jgi:hypothetical protein
MVTIEDIESCRVFEDTIAVFPGGVSKEKPHVYFPYRCLVPEKIDGLLVACRAFSSDDETNTRYNLIPHCIAFGEVAGTAAALSIKDGVEPRQVDVGALQSRLLGQGVLLPGIEKVNQKV